MHANAEQENNFTPKNKWGTNRNAFFVNAQVFHFTNMISLKFSSYKEITHLLQNASVDE